MVRLGYLLALVFGAVVLASCAQQEEPVTVEPTYDKVGGAVCEAGLYLDTSQPQDLACVAACPRGASVASTAAGQLICVPGGCPQGTVATAGAQGQICVPVREPDGGRQTTPNDPQRPGTP